MPSLAHDEITITLDSETIRLRPKLKAAYRLEHRYGFPAIVKGISEGSVSIMCDIILECSDRILLLKEGALRRSIETLAGPLLELVFAMIGFDGEQNNNADSGERISFPEYFEKLFSLGSGALGWTPAETWAATPQEILCAYRGRQELIALMFGGGKQEEQSGPINHTPEQVAAGLATLRGMAASGRNKGV